MKKVILIIALGTALLSCKKEEVEKNVCPAPDLIEDIECVWNAVEYEF